MDAYMFTQPAGPLREHQLRTTLGSASISVGLAYFLASYMPVVAENQFLHASVPLRLLASVLLGVKTWSERRTLSKEARKDFLWVAAYGGALGLFLGWQLGRWDGRASGSWIA